jgi:transcriptional regulator with XRE-family HTH domain
VPEVTKRVVELRKTTATTRRAGRPDELIGKRIRALRIEAGITQEELADRIGLSSQQLQKYEAGANRVSVSRLLDISEVLGVDIATVVSANDARCGVPDEHYAKDVQKLLSCFNSIRSRESRRKVIELSMILANYEPQPPEH